MTESEILADVTSIVREALDDDSIELTAESSANDYPEWDSFKHIAIVVATEVRYGVKFQTAEIESLKSVGDFVSLIMQKAG